MSDLSKLIAHQPKRETLIKFVLLVLVFVAYFFYLSWKYDFATGGGVAAITWSFFVLCTPVADAGFLLDFPVRLITSIRMIYTEIGVWIIAIAINLLFFFTAPQFYETTFLTRLFFEILSHPWPYGGIIVLCGIGTFVSIAFGDEVMDVASHSERSLHHKHGFAYRALMSITLFVLIIVAYGFVLKTVEIAETQPSAGASTLASKSLAS
jgi:hypothetical protein